MKIALMLGIIVLGAHTMAIAAADTLAPDGLDAAERGVAVGPSAKGANVLRAQVLLGRAHFSSGEIDGAYGNNLRQAIAGFQKARQLSPTGVIDAATWAALESDRAPILSTYTITAADAIGPFATIPPKMADKAKLSALGYANVAEALGEKFHTSPVLLKLLNPGKDLSRTGEQITAPNLEAAGALPKAATIVVARADGTLTLLDASGQAVGQFPATTGSAHDPLPIGNWKVQDIVKNPVYRYNPKLFWDAKASDAKARIAGGPNNPVGVVWIGLSKAHYGIHGTPEPSTIGKTQSHGCIRLTNWDASAVAQAVGPGTPVILQN